MSKLALPAVSGKVDGSARTGHLFCERCGTAAPLIGPAGASFCMGCRLYLCAACAPAGELRCGACRQSGSRALQGLRAACHALEALREVERDLLAMVEAYEKALTDGGPASPDNDIPGSVQRLEDLEIKQRAAEAAVDHALSASRRRDSRRATEIRTQMFGVLASIELAAARVRERKDGGGATWTALSRLDPGRRLSRNALVAVALWLVAGAVGAAALNLWLGGRSVPAQVGTAPTSAPLVGVAATPVGIGEVAGGTPAAAQNEVWSFDQLRMGSSLPGGFALRASEGAFAVVPMPNAIDRSLRLRATVLPSALCHRLSGVATTVAVRVRLEGTLLGGSELVDVISADGSRLIGAVLTDAAMLELHGPRPPLVIGRPTPGQWYDLRLRLNPDGTASLILDDEGGTELGRGTVQLEYPISTQQVCFGLPAGEPAAELYIDDLRITY